MSVIDLARPHPSPVTPADDLSAGRLRHLLLLAIAAVIVLNVADIVTTRIDLAAAAHAGKRLVEGNPLAGLLLAGGQVEALKATILLAMAWRARTRPPRIGVLCGLWAVAGVYGMTVLSNVLALSTLG